MKRNQSCEWNFWTGPSQTNQSQYLRNIYGQRWMHRGKDSLMLDSRQMLAPEPALWHFRCTRITNFTINTRRKRLLEYTGPGSLWAKMLIFIYKNINKHFKCKNKRSNEWSTIIQHWVWLNGPRDMKAKRPYHLSVLSNYIIITIYIKTRGPGTPSVDTWSRLPPTAPRLVANHACSYGRWGWQRVPNSESPPWYSLGAEWLDIPEPAQFHTWGDLIQVTATFPGGCLRCVPDCECRYLHSCGAVAPDPGPETCLPWWTEGTKCRPSNPKQQLPSHARIRSTVFSRL